MTDSSSNAAMPLDEKIYYLFLVGGLAIIAAFFTVTLVRSHREDAAKAQVPARQLIDFALTNQAGQVLYRTNVAGRQLVVSFVFTSCGISCLQVNRHMSEIQRRTADQPDVQLLSLSVDPRSDTPARLALFGDQFGANPTRWQFLTGDKQVIYPLIENSFLGQAEATPHEGGPAGMIHSDQIAVMDSAGRLRALFDGLKPTVVDDVLRALERDRTGGTK